MSRPILGVSMGDPFGNGPEITVRALADAAVYDRCKPLVVGDESSMRYALKVAEKVNGIHLELNVVKTPAEGKYTYGTIDLMDLGLVPAEEIPDTSDLDEPKPFGVGACAVGGEASFQYVKKVIELAMANLASKGGFKAYALLILVAMLGASLMSGSTGYYVMVITIASTIPYSKNLPNSKVLLPMAFASGKALIPVSVAFFMGMAVSLLESAGMTVTVAMPKFSLMVFISSVGFLLWTLFAYRLLPDYDIQADGQDKKESAVAQVQEGTQLPKWKEICTYLAFAVSVAAMMISSLGEISAILPCLATGFLCLIGVFDFKEARANLFSPLILMMASVIGVANALADSGFTTMVGEAVASAMGGHVSYFVLTLVFCLLTSACATLTGASMGALFVFAPIGIATAMSLGIDPTGLACAMAVSAWSGGFLPIDGMPAMALGMGKYKLSQFLVYAVPMYLIGILFLSIGAVIAFPL